MNGLVRDIEQWARDRNLHEGDPLHQMCKLLEETGETASAVIRLTAARKELASIEASGVANPLEIQKAQAKVALYESKAKDGIGDSVVVLTIVAMRLGFNLQDCVDQAYTEIKDRKGKNIGGVFHRETATGVVQS
jgi:hypothetical protein